MKEPLTLSEYQKLAMRSDLVPGEGVTATAVPLLGLAGEVGSLLTEYKKQLREGARYRPFADHVSEEIGDVLWYLANLAAKAGLDLGEIAEENLAKVAERWDTCGDTPQPPTAYDESFPALERLPESIRVEFHEVPTATGVKLALVSDGRRLGDLLTDNAHSADGYRFHDVFHLSYAILLGWSPVTRKLLGRKRKSNARIDEVEDGARAAVTEEAIAALVFGYAKDYSFFEGATSVDYDLLRAIRLMTRSFEVRDRSLRDWEQTILRGYDAWRAMVASNGGVLVGDRRAQLWRVESRNMRS